MCLCLSQLFMKHQMGAHCPLFFQKAIQKETANHSEHSFANCHWRLNTYTTKPRTSQWTQLEQLTQTETQPLLVINAYSNPPRTIKATIFQNNEHTNIIISKLGITLRNADKTSDTFTLPSPRNTCSRKNNKVANTTPDDIH